MVFSAPELAPGGRPYTVREIVQAIRRTLDVSFPRSILVTGEITNFVSHASGHRYFTLRDGDAALGCVMFNDHARHVRFKPADGMRVEASGLVTVYPKQGRLQLQVETMVLAGTGDLIARREQLRAMLDREGLFASERKRPLPAYVRTVGLVTSPSGAAVRDFVRLIRLRAPGTRILLAPAQVQGEGAASSIARAIERQNRYGAAEVLLVGRGGGSLEDLWAFNEEPVVRAIAASRIPVVSAVGHESDLTLADLAADERAATPSHAVELAVPDTRDLLAKLARIDRRLTREMTSRLLAERARLAAVRSSYALRQPSLMLKAGQQRVDELCEAMAMSLAHLHERHGTQLAALARRLPVGLGQKKRTAKARLELVLVRLAGTARTLAPERKARVEGLAGRLDALGPGQVLRRGYVLVRRPDGETVTGTRSLAAGDRVELNFHDGRAAAEICAIVPGEPLPGAGSSASIPEEKE